MEDGIDDHFSFTLHLIYSLLCYLINSLYLHFHLLLTSVLFILEIVYDLEHVFQLFFDLIISSYIAIIISQIYSGKLYVDWLRGLVGVGGRCRGRWPLL